MLKWLMKRDIFVGDFFKLMNHMIGHKQSESSENDQIYLVDYDAVYPRIDVKPLAVQFLNDFEDDREEVGYSKYWERLDPEQRILKFLEEAVAAGPDVPTANQAMLGDEERLFKNVVAMLATSNPIEKVYGCHQVVCVLKKDSNSPFLRIQVVGSISRL